MQLSDSQRRASALAYTLASQSSTAERPLSTTAEGTRNLGEYVVSLEAEVERLETIVYGQRILNWCLFAVTMICILATGLCFSYNH